MDAPNELSLDEYIDTLSKLRTMGLRFIKLTGGEPFLKKDLVFGLIDWSSRNSVGVSIETNGSLLDEADIERLGEHPRLEMSVSLDFPTAPEFNEFRRHPRAFSSATRAISLLVKSKIPTTVTATIYRPNLPLVFELASLTLESLGAASIKLSPCSDVGRAERELSGEFLSPNEVLTLAAKVLELAHRYPERVGAMLPWALVNPFEAEVLILGRCEISKVIGILPTGDVSICGIGLTEPETVLGNVRTGDVVDLWLQNPVLVGLRNTPPDRYHGVCGNCIFVRYCANICPAQAYSKYRDYYGPYPLCQQLQDAGLFPSEYLVGEN